MRGFFAKNLLFVISVNLLVKPLWIFLIDRTVQNTVGHESYGTYQSLFNLGLIFQILLDFGINYYNSKSVAQHPERIKQLFPAMLSARVVLSLLYMVIVCGIGLLIGYRAWEIFLLLGVLVIQALNSVILFVRSNVAGLHKFRADGVLSVTDRSLMIVVCGFLLFYHPLGRQFKIEWFVGAQIICYGIAIFISLALLKKISGVRLRFSLDYKQIFQIIKESYPYALLIFFMALYTRSDMILIERLSGEQGARQAGIYAAAYRLLDVGNMFGIMVGSMLLPIFSRDLSLKNSVQPIVQFCTRLILPASLLVTISAVLFHQEIMQLLYRETAPGDATVFAWLMVAFPAFSLTNVYATLLAANGDLKLLNKLGFIGVVLSFGFNFILIPEYHSLGAAFTSCITQYTLTLAFMYFSLRRLHLPVHSRGALMYLLYGLSLLALGYLVKRADFPWLAQISVIFIMGSILIVLFGFISFSGLKKLIQKN